MTFNDVWFTTSCVRQQLYRFNLQQKNRRARHEANTKRGEVLLSTKWNIWYRNACIYELQQPATQQEWKIVTSHKSYNWFAIKHEAFWSELFIVLWTQYISDKVAFFFFFWVSETRGCHSLRVGKVTPGQNKHCWQTESAVDGCLYGFLTRWRSLLILICLAKT